jgi:propanediol dehydratase small subunit
LRTEASEDDPRRRESIVSPEQITLENLLAGKFGPEDVTIRRKMLEAQAARAEAEGYAQLGRNFRRAAELVGIPGQMLLEMYEKLRPNRSRYDELLALSQEVAARFDAPETGAYIREAAEVYREKGLVREK